MGGPAKLQNLSHWGISVLDHPLWKWKVGTFASVEISSEESSKLSQPFPPRKTEGEKMQEKLLDKHYLSKFQSNNQS